MLRLVVALAAALLLTGVARADLRVEYEGSGKSLVAMSLAGGKIRVDADADHSVIFDPASDTIVTLDHRKRRYTRMGPQEIAAMRAAARQALAEVEQSLAHLPPEVRAQMVGGVLGGRPVVSVVASGQSEQVDGITCNFYRVEALGQLVAEVCLARLEDIPWLGSEERSALAELQRMQQRMTEGLREGPLTALATSPFSLEGFPLVQVDHSGRRPARSVVARSARAPLPATLFEPPSNYKEEKLDPR